MHYGLNPGCYWKRAKPSLSEYNGDLDARGSETLGIRKGADMLPEGRYIEKLRRPRRIYPIRVFDKRGKQTKYISGDAIEASILLSRANDGTKKDD